MSITAIIVDDEQDAREVVLEYTKLYCPYVEVIGVASTYLEAKKLLSEKQADLLFLDINLDEKDSIQLLTEIGPIKSQIIFITAYKTYAFDAFAFETIDYLLKPIDPIRFQESTERVRKLVESRRISEASTNGLINEPSLKYGEKFAISSMNTTTIIDPSKLMRLHGDGAYVQLLLSTPEALFSSRGLKQFDFLLEHDVFIKVHQSHIVNLDFCKGLVSGEKNYLLTTDGHKVPVARRKKDLVKAYFNKLEIK